MRITSKGQVTIPADIRERAGLLPNTEVEFTYDGEIVRLTRSDRPGRGALVVETLRGRSTAGLGTDAIMALTRGDHAAVAGYRLLTRDAVRYRTYFPKLDLVAPDIG